MSTKNNQTGKKELFSIFQSVKLDAVFVSET